MPATRALHSATLAPAMSRATRSAATINKVLRARLQRLADAIAERIGDFGYRVFVDSAPVLEKALARNAGLGWIGTHTNLLDRDGSWFLLGEIYTDLPLPRDAPASRSTAARAHTCLDVCHTGAIVAPYEPRCAPVHLYLRSSWRGGIRYPRTFARADRSNRIFGCDDCQLFCPWNKFAHASEVDDFAPRHALDGETLVELFGWSETEWETRTAGSAIRRAGYEGWLAQCRGRARQRAAGARDRRRANRPPRRCLADRARARRVGAAPARAAHELITNEVAAWFTAKAHSLLVPYDGSFDARNAPTLPEQDHKKSEHWKDLLEAEAKALGDAQYRLYADGRYALLLVFQALDAAGKDSTIRRVFSGVNPCGLEVTHRSAAEPRGSRPRLPLANQRPPAGARQRRGVQSQSLRRSHRRARAPAVTWPRSANP